MMIPKISIDINKTLDFLQRNAKEITIVILALVFIYLFSSVRNQRQEIDALNNQNLIHQNNILALTDSVTTYRTQNGQLTQSRRALIGDVETISAMNRQLRDELQQEHYEVQSLQALVAELSNKDTIIVYVDVPVFADSTDGIYTVPWSWSNEFTQIVATSRFTLSQNDLSVNDFSTTLNYIMQIPIVTGINKVSDSEWRIFVRSQNPDITFTNIQGFSVPSSTFASNEVRRPRPWGIGFQAGYGATRHGLSPYMGVGLSYNPLTF